MWYTGSSFFGNAEYNANMLLWSSALFDVLLLLFYTVCSEVVVCRFLLYPSLWLTCGNVAMTAATWLPSVTNQYAKHPYHRLIHTQTVKHRDPRRPGIKHNSYTQVKSHTPMYTQILFPTNIWRQCVLLNLSLGLAEVLILTIDQRLTSFHTVQVNINSNITRKRFVVSGSEWICTFRRLWVTCWHTQGGVLSILVKNIK